MDHPFLLLFGLQFLFHNAESCCKEDVRQMSLNCCSCNFTVVPIDLLTNLKRLDLSFNPLRHLYYKQFSQLSELHFLDLTRCSIISIEDNAFFGLENLHTLILTGNPIKHWSPLTFSGLSFLKRLIVVETHLTSLSELPVAHLSFLQELNVARNLLKSLHIPYLHSLQTLNLRANQITEIQENDLENLRYVNISYLSLILSQNQIHHISPGAFRLISLDKLDLRGCFSNADIMKTNLNALSGLCVGRLVIGQYRNALNKLYYKNRLLEGLCGMNVEELTINGMFFEWTHPFFDCIENITSLQLVNTELRNFLSNSVISNMEKLELKNCLLTNIYATMFLKFTSLKEIRITYNKRLSGFDEEIPELNGIELLDISRNNIVLESCCPGISSLRHLNFSHNAKIGLAARFLNMPHLLSLDFRNTRVSNVGQFPIFNLLDKLTYLDLSHTKCHFMVHYSFSGLHHLEQLYLAHTTFATDILGSVFHNMTRLRILDMSSCGLHHIPMETFSHLKLLQILDLSKNRLLDLQFLVLNPLTSLISLDISSNNFQGLTENTAEFIFQNIEKVNISQNPFDCSCNQQSFLSWINKKDRVLDFKEHLVCKTPKNLQGENLYDVNLNCNFFLHVLAALAGILICSLTAIFIYRCYSQKYFYLCYLFCQTDKKNFTDKEYDAFVIHSSLDEDWVKEQLVPKLEGCNPPFQLCLHYRDFLPGIAITSNIVNEGIRRSRNVLIIVSPNFIESKWCSFEFEMAMSWQFLENQCGIIVIILEAVEEARLKHMIGLNKYMRKNTYLKWADGYLERKVFWMRLSEALRQGSQIKRFGSKLNDPSGETLCDKHKEHNKMNLQKL